MAVHRQLFWPLAVLGALLLMLAGASFAAALFSIELPPNIGLMGYHAFLGRVTSLSWSADQGFPNRDSRIRSNRSSRVRHSGSRPLGRVLSGDSVPDSVPTQPGRVVSNGTEAGPKPRFRP
jgi:hypothetical protein